MRLIRENMKLTAHQAIELEHQGFILRLKDFGLMLWDVFVED